MTMIWNISFLYFFNQSQMEVVISNLCPWIVWTLTVVQNSRIHCCTSHWIYQLENWNKLLNALTQLLTKFMYLKSVLKVLTLSNFLSLLSLSKVMDGLLIWFFGLKHLRLHLQNKIRISLEFLHLIFINWGFLST